MMNDNTITKLQKLQSEFSSKRNWDKYHSPKNLSMALSVEASELVEIFQWLNDRDIESKMNDADFTESVGEEIADIFLYLLRLSEKMNINIEAAVISKIEKNKIKYPVELSKNNAVKYNKRNNGEPGND